MNDVRRLLVIKANLETVMQRDLETSVRVYAEQQLDAVCKEIEKAREEFGKLFEPQEIDQLKQRVSELEASNAELLGVAEHFCCHRNMDLIEGTCVLRCGRIKNGMCQQATDCWILKAIQKASGQG